MAMEVKVKAVSNFLERHAVNKLIEIERHGKPRAVMIPYKTFQAVHKESCKALLLLSTNGGAIAGFMAAQTP